MNKHLTEQQLIDYQFKLADEAGLDEARAHLDQCEPCCQRLEKLVRRFAALELLRDDIRVPQDLLSRTVEKAVRAPRSRIVRLYRVPALGTVAAAVIAGAALLLVSHPPQDKQLAPTTVLAPSAENATPAVSSDKDYVSRKDQPMPLVAGSAGQAESAAPSKPPSLKERVEGVRTPGIAALLSGTEKRANQEIGGPGQDAGDATPHAVTANAVDAVLPRAQAPAIAEKPPFAPASAIELVVLPRRENVQLTIYNGADLTLVRERRNLTLKKGWNWLQFMWANTLIDPTSLALEPLEHRDAVRVEQLVFPPRLRELGRWLIHSDVDGQVPFELTYFTSGLAWRAFYLGTLAPDEKTMRLESYVRINNGSGEDYEDARTRLVVGRVHLLDQIRDLAQRQYAYGSPSRIRGSVSATGFEGAARDGDFSPRVANGDVAGRALGLLERKEIRKEGLSEYFLYTIEGTETIPNEWGKRLLSFQADDIPVMSLYKYDEERWGSQAVRFLSFANDTEHKLGATPLPDGTVRIYGRADGEGHLSYVGAMDVKYIPVGEKVELNLGPARLVEVKPVLMETRTQNHTFDNKGNVSGWDDVQTWKVEIANTRSLPVEVEVTRGFGTPNWTLKPGDGQATYEKYDATHARFKLTVEPRSKRVFEYTVTAYRGARAAIGQVDSRVK